MTVKASILCLPLISAGVSALGTLGDSPAPREAGGVWGCGVVYRPEFDRVERRWRKEKTCTEVGVLFLGGGRQSSSFRTDVYRAELLDADEALWCSDRRPGCSSPQSSMSTSLRERGTNSAPGAPPRRRPSPWAFSDPLRARRTETMGLRERNDSQKQKGSWKVWGRGMHLSGPSSPKLQLEIC